MRTRTVSGAVNVVVMFVQYDGGVGALQAEAVLTGFGKLEVFTGGKMITGTWSFVRDRGVYAAVGVQTPRPGRRQSRPLREVASTR